MNKAPLKSSRPHIGIFGRRNVGKSSLINVLAAQDVAIVSDHPGTTTDPVKKTIEIHGFGPVVMIDTAGIDDIGDVGKLRIQRTLRIIEQIDLAVLVLAENVFSEYEQDLIKQFMQTHIPYLIVHNKCDLAPLSKALKDELRKSLNVTVIDESAINPKNIETIIASLRAITPSSLFANSTIVGDLVSYGDVVLLVTPIDVQAPEGRLILPQVQTIRDCLDNDCITVIIKERELDAYWKKVGIQPKLVVTDSQVFLKVSSSVPPTVPLTSFSILFARMKGPFDHYLKGTQHIASLKDGERVLILESCSHHVASDDIGRVKIPRWLVNFTGKKLEFEMAAGLNSPTLPITDYRLVIQCGGCMITKKQVLQRLLPALEAGIPITNYGMAIAYCLGIYERAIAPFTRGGFEAINYI